MDYVIHRTEMQIAGEIEHSIFSAADRKDDNTKQQIHRTENQTEHPGRGQRSFEAQVQSDGA